MLLGGAGRPGPVRELTEIEEEILTSVVQLVVRELNTAWLSVGLQFAFEQREPAGKATNASADSVESGKANSMAP